MAVSPRSDEAIQEEVLDELKWDPPRVRVNEVGVIVKDGIVTLIGWVDSLTQKIAAEEAVRRVRGIKAIVNDIEVCTASKIRPLPCAHRVSHMRPSVAAIRQVGKMTSSSHEGEKPKFAA